MEFLLDLLPGLAITLQLWVAIMAISLVAGIILGLGLNGPVASLRRILGVVVFIGRAFPGLVILYLVYVGLPEAGVLLDSFGAVVLAFSFTGACYVGEMMRGAIAAVPSGSIEASEALGVSSFMTALHIVVPQAMRIIVGPLIGFATMVLQAISLAFSVGLKDVVGEALSLGSVNFSTIPYMASAGVIYFVICGLLAYALHLWNRRNGAPRAPKTSKASLASSAI